MKKYQRYLCCLMICTATLFPFFSPQFIKLKLFILAFLRFLPSLEAQATVNSIPKNQEREVSVLRAKLALAYTEISQLREQINSLTRFRKKFSQHTLVIPAEVILHRGSSQFDQMVLINRGTKDGVCQGAPVVLGDSLVGKIHQAGPWISWVSLITDPSIKIKIFLVSNKDGAEYGEGILVGTGDDTCCQLKFVPRNVKVEAGDLVLTSDFGNMYPRGLVVGEIIPSDDLNYGLFTQAQVRPIPDMDHLSVVLVVGQ